MRYPGLRNGLLFFLLLSGASQAGAQRASGFSGAIDAIALGADTAARRLAIINDLESAGIAYRLEEFTFLGISGTNIVATVPGAKTARTFLLGAHYDRVAQGQGAVDNASSCAILLRLLAEFRSKPLANYSVTAVFFDLEERGLIGSQAYFAKSRDGGLPAEAVNLDIFAYGDTLFAAASAMDGPLAGALQEAAKQSPIAVRLVPPRQYPASDHRSMMTAGVETLGLALIDGPEIDAILQPGSAPPRILTIIHTAEDTTDKVRGEDMDRAFPVLEKMIRLIDRKIS